jgi:hypothetical protein
MNSQAIVPVRNNVAVIPWGEKQLATMRRQLANDATPDEFDMFIQYCIAQQLDPFQGHVILVVYNKSARDPAKRKPTIITTQQGMRVKADRCGNYHPAKPGDTTWTYTPYQLERQRWMDEVKVIRDGKDRTAKLAEIHENMPPDAANPAGLLECRTVIYKGGDPVEGIARWTAYAPLKPHDDCFELKPSGEYYKNKDGSQGREIMRRKPKAGVVLADHMVLDTSGRWGEDGEGMLQKCGTVHALKAGFPDHFGHRFETEETVEKLRVADLTASELADIGEQERRMNAIGASKDEYVWTDAAGLDGFHPAGAYGDVVLKSVRACKFREDFDRLMDQRLNQESFNRFWANHRADALDVKTAFEEYRDKLPRKPKVEATVATVTASEDREASPAPAHA